MSKIDNTKLNKICKYIPFIVSALVIAGLEMLGELLDAMQVAHEAWMPYTMSAKTLIFMGIKGIVIWIAVSIGLYILWKYGKKIYDGAGSKCVIFKGKLYVWLVLIIAWTPCFLAYFPGIYSYDGEPQLIQYITGEFDNHHPVLHTLIIGGCYNLGQWLKANGINIDGLAFYSIIQMMLLAFALATVIMYLVKKNVGRGILWLTMAMFTIFPVTPVMAISTTKDTFFTAFFLIFLVELIQYLDGDKPGKMQALYVLVNAVFTMLFRRNASYVFMILIVVFAIVSVSRLIKNKKIGTGFFEKGVLIFLCSYIVFTASESIILNATDAVQGETAEALSVPLMQIARAFNSNQDAVLEKYGDVLLDYISHEGLGNYRPLISDGVKQHFNNELFAKDKGSFVKLYLSLLKDYPGSYVQAFLYMTKGDWQLMDNSHCEVYKNWWRDRTGYLITDATPVFALGYVEKTDILPGLRNVYEKIVTECSYRCFFGFKLLFAPAVYVFMVILSGLALLLKKRFRLLSLWAIIGLYLLTIIAGPCVLIRYIFPLMMAMPILTVLIFGNEDSKNNY